MKQDNAISYGLVDTTINHGQLYSDLQKTSGYKDNFTYEGALALMEYLDNLARDCEIQIEYDPIGFCCGYVEYETIGMLCDDYSNAPQADEFDCPDEWEEKALEYFNENTTVIEFDGGIIIQQF